MNLLGKNNVAHAMLCVIGLSKHTKYHTRKIHVDHLQPLLVKYAYVFYSRIHI